ncbi:MAG: Gfo/Idh/MocA family oxidoreductase [Bacteroidales bacterium]|nr:Gfo/Idh/MocA family oxidoreductase [Bacteroidales bacterium]
MKRKLRMGMIGGGTDAFIGAIHRAAAFMDNRIELVCGCFSIKPEISISSGKQYFVPDDRIYTSYQEMFEKESKLPKDKRMDFVTIVTPNFAHFEPAMMALDLGFNVVIEKPMTFNLDQAKKLRDKVNETGLTLALTHTYSGYPAVKQAKQMIEEGKLGNIRKVFVEYTQGWLSDRVELQGENNATWRTDPKRSGKGGCVGDIGTHAWHLSEYITGQKVTKVCGELNAFVPGRPIDDDAAAFFEYDGGAKGVLMACQVAIGEENALKIRVYGDKGGIEWNQQEPNTLLFKTSTRPTEIYRVGNGFMNDASKFNTRTPGGHPEGYIEAFANIYKNFSLTLDAKLNGETPSKAMLDFPNVNDGVRGMQFVETMVASGYDENKKWFDWVE